MYNKTKDKKFRNLTHDANLFILYTPIQKKNHTSKEK